MSIPNPKVFTFEKESPIGTAVYDIKADSPSDIFLLHWLDSICTGTVSNIYFRLDGERFLIDSGNNKIDFSIASVPYVATVTNAIYTIGSSDTESGTLCAAISSALNAAYPLYTPYKWAVTFDRATRILLISTLGSPGFVLLFGTGANFAFSIASTIGFYQVDTGAATYHYADYGVRMYPFANAAASSLTHEEVGEPRIVFTQETIIHVVIERSSSGLDNFSYYATKIVE